MKKKILNANKKDLLNANSKKIENNVIDRLRLNSKKILQIRKSIDKIIKFKSPIDKILSSWKRPNGITIKKTSIPIGVIGVIYESRPNVTSDVSALCFKSGNVVILRGGSEAFYSNKILFRLFKKALKKKNCDENCVQFIEYKDKVHVDYLLSSMKKYVDLIIPRGGKGLVKKVLKKSTIPIVGHYEGLCHVYVDKNWFDKLPKKEDAEQDMLDMAFEPNNFSRLGCQIPVSDDLDGMVVKMPSKQA